MDYTESFEDEVRKGSATARCEFDISYNDEVVHNVDITCRQVSRAIRNKRIDYERTTITMHTIYMTFKIVKKGKKWIGKLEGSPNIETGNKFLFIN